MTPTTLPDEVREMVERLRDEMVEEYAVSRSTGKNAAALLERLARELTEARAEIQTALESTIQTGGDYVCADCCVQKHEACEREECDCIACLKRELAERDEALHELESCREQIISRGHEATRLGLEVVDMRRELTEARETIASRDRQVAATEATRDPLAREVIRLRRELVEVKQAAQQHYLRESDYLLAETQRLARELAEAREDRELLLEIVTAPFPLRDYCSERAWERACNLVAARTAERGEDKP